MNLFRQPLVNGVKCPPLKSSNSVYSLRRQLSIPSSFPRTLNPIIFALQIRLKSKRSKFHRPAAAPPPSNASPPSGKSSANSPPPIRPIRPRKTVDVIYEKPTAIGSILVDLKNWRHSRLLLTIVVNSAAFIVFSLWTLEAHNAAKGKERLDDNQSTGAKDESAGRYVPGTTTEKRFLT